MPKKPIAAALLYDEDFHLLDHIAPLAYLLNIPLYLTEEKVFALAKEYYPMTDAKLLSNQELSLKFLSKFDALFQSKPWLPHSRDLFSALFDKKIRLFFCPHGNSDKGHLSKQLHSYAFQDVVLYYGGHMKKALEKLGIWNTLSSPIRIGNFRKMFFDLFSPFYQKIIEKKLSPFLDPSLKTLFYAPTWQDKENSSSFYSLLPILYEKVSPFYNLIIKPHPLLKENDPARYFSLSLRAPKNVILLEDFPPVYPLFSVSDAYLGDFSSVGYDFLSTKKPMFFSDPNERSLDLNRTHQLFPCGVVMEKKDLLNLPSLLKEKIHDWPSSLIQKQEKLYKLAFGKEVNLPKLQKQIASLL